MHTHTDAHAHRTRTPYMHIAHAQHTRKPQTHTIHAHRTRTRKPTRHAHAHAQGLKSVSDLSIIFFFKNFVNKVYLYFKTLQRDF